MHEDKQPPAGAENGSAAHFGSEYAQWKTWDSATFGSLTQSEEASISAEIKKSQAVLPPQSRVLEIGFGNGAFLAYGNKRQWEVHGTEINPELVRRAQESGFRAVETGDLQAFSDKYFDLVVAFDVLEHIPREKLASFLTEIKRVMKDGAVFIARFPNGDSPIGMPYQHGDPTHMTTIGSSQARFFANMLGVELLYIGGAAQPLLGGHLGRVHGVITFPIRFAVNWAINLIFYPRRSIAFCSPNLVLIFRTAQPAR